MTTLSCTAKVSLVAVAVATALAGCTSGESAPAPTPQAVVTGTRTVITTRTVAPPSPGSAATSVAAFPPDGKAPKGEVLKTCPYIKGGLDSEPTSGPNVADIEGDRVGRITVLTDYQPVGCRFYFAYAYGDTDREAVADILPHTYGSATEARNAMIRTAGAGSEAFTVRNFVPGVTGIRYRTRFFGPDGPRDWAFVFAKGTHMVVVHTQQTNASLNAQLLAAAIASKF